MRWYIWMFMFVISNVKHLRPNVRTQACMCPFDPLHTAISTAHWPSVDDKALSCSVNPLLLIAASPIHPQRMEVLNGKSSLKHRHEGDMKLKSLVFISAPGATLLYMNVVHRGYTHTHSAPSAACPTLINDNEAELADGVRQSSVCS